MKTGYERLKEICDLIGYNINSGGYEFIKNEDGINFINHIFNDGIEVEVTEIIFDPEFMKSLVVHLDKINLLGEVRNYEDIGKGIIFNLKNPVNYLYNKLGLND